MTAGAKDQYITFERKTRVSNNAGGAEATWSTLVVAWAKVIAKAGQESLSEGRTNATFVNLFTVWQSDCAAVVEADRIVWNSETWNIRGIRREGARRIELVIEAERGVAS